MLLCFHVRWRERNHLDPFLTLFPGLPGRVSIILRLHAPHEGLLAQNPLRGRHAVPHGWLGDHHWEERLPFVGTSLHLLQMRFGASIGVTLGRELVIMVLRGGGAETDFLACLGTYSRPLQTANIDTSDSHGGPPVGKGEGGGREAQKTAHAGGGGDNLHRTYYRTHLIRSHVGRR